MVLVTRINQVSAVDDRLQEEQERREAKEQEMKNLERKLVELLVAQQKKLLAILQEASNSSKNSEIIDEADPEPSPRGFQPPQPLS
jgi:hypothetical protein